ncbi:MAG: alanine racemase [Flavobacteriaceae bacterium]|nr:alanine racemase [Flavobacteriaceae bacterium]
MNNATILEIDKSAIQHNLTYFKSKLKKDTLILVVIKAFAYGSDAIILANILKKEKVDYLAVAYTEEGVVLRKAGINLPIIVLHPQIQNFKILIQNYLEPNLYTKKTLLQFIDIANSLKLKKYPIHIKFNTGLNRLGFKTSDVSEIIMILKNKNTIALKSVFSHLAASEDLNEKVFTENQITSFKEIKKKFDASTNPNKPIFHLLNTSGIVNYLEAQFDMVRLGIGIYGFANEDKITKKLQNVLCLKSIISQIHILKKGETVGYNRIFKITQLTKIATIPIGHADGVSRQLGNKKSYVTIHNQKAYIIGNVCMDILMVDVTTINCQEGDIVVVFDSQKKIIEMSKTMNTIPYELLTMISQRVNRVLKKNKYI